MNRLTRLDRIAIVVALLALIAVPLLGTGYVIYVANLLLVMTVLALGMHLVIGETGQFALSHAAFFGLGIYTAALLNKHLGWPFPLSILAAALIAGALGVFIGWLALRMRDIYLALATFALGEAMQWVFLNWTSVTNGSNGLTMKPATLGPWVLKSDAEAYPFVVVGAIGMLLLTIALCQSRLGLSWRAVRESEVAARAMGVHVRAVKVTAFALSAVYAGVAGGIYTLFTSFIHPESLGFQTTILVLTMVVVGGLGSVRGAVVGAIVFGLISELLRQAPSYQEIIYGAVLMGFMMFAPKGLAAWLERGR